MSLETLVQLFRERAKQMMAARSFGSVVVTFQNGKPTVLEEKRTEKLSD